MNNSRGKQQTCELLEQDQTSNSNSYILSAHSKPAHHKQTLSISEKRKEVQQVVTYEKVICYISAFHINVNDWFSEYENIEIFN